ncbi:hypothetical protein DICA3_D00804 [Diutina catenulata]
MKFITFAACVATAIAGQSFGLITSHSGSVNTHLRSWEVNEYGIVTLDSGEPVKLVLNSDGSLVDTNSGKYITLGKVLAPKDNRRIFVTSTEAGTDTWSIKDNHLKYSGTEGFVACPHNGQWALFSGNTDNACEGFSAVVQSVKDVEDATVGN